MPNRNKICNRLCISSDFMGICAMANSVNFLGIDCRIVKQKYPGNDQIALQLITNEGHPVATATSCLVNYPFGSDQTAIKNYSENQGILEVLLSAGIIQDTGISVQSGYCLYPIVKVLI